MLNVSSEDSVFSEPRRVVSSCAFHTVNSRMQVSCSPAHAEIGAKCLQLSEEVGSMAESAGVEIRKIRVLQMGNEVSEILVLLDADDESLSHLRDLMSEAGFDFLIADV